MKKRYNIFIGFLLIINSLNAQNDSIKSSKNQEPTLLLQQYREMALDYNHNLKVARKNIEASIELEKAAQANLLPTLSADASYKYTANPMQLDAQLPDMPQPLHFEGTHEQYGGVLNIVQPIYLGGKLLAAMDLAEHQRHFSEHQEALIESSVYYQTDIQYLTTVARKELTGVTANLCQSMDDLRTIIKQRVDCGLVDQQDLWMVEVKLNEAKLKHLDTQNSYEVGVMALNALIGEEAQTKTQVENTLPEITTYTQQAANQRPEIDMAHEQVELAKVQKKFNDSKYRPQISAGISGSYGSPAYDFNPDLDPNMGAFVQVHIPLYEWGKRRKERKANQLKIEMANEQLLQQEENISLQQSQAQLTINQCIKSLKLAKSSLEKAEQNQATILTRYESGLVPIVSVIDAQLYTETAYSNFVRSKLNAQIAYSELQRALHLYPNNEVSK